MNLLPSITRCGSIALLALLSAFASAQQTSTPSTSSSVVIVLSTALYKTSDMQFGFIFPGASGGTVVLSTSSSRTATGSVMLPSGGTHSAAGFVVLGTPNTTFSVSYPTSITLNRAGGSASMTISSIVGSPSTGGTLSSGGSATVNVGGTLTVAANQMFGQYSGSFNVTVSYP